MTTPEPSSSVPRIMRPDQEHRQLENQLMRKVQQACKSYGLLEPGDRVMVALSGGKDSYTMLHMLRLLQVRLPFKVELVAVHLDQRQPGYDGEPLRRWLADSGAEYEILSEDTYSVVTEHLDDSSTYCSLCSRLRRGILYTAAERIGANKIALGHHRNDTLETFLMNLFYAGKLQAMPAAYTTDDGRFRVIRPLIECDEAQIARFAALEAFPILPCNLCGSQTGLKRDKMTALLETLEAEHPHVKSVMMNALANVRPTHLLDQEVLEAWETRPEHIRPAPEVTPREAHAAAEPVAASRGRLRVIQ
jgi:tRNA 2-thiocytidine biosynthesis protein TtcA